MAVDPDLELRVSRLENDNNAIYDLISELRSLGQQHSLRFDGVDQRFDGLDHRFDGVDQRFDGVGLRLDSIDERLDSVRTTLVEVVRRLPEPS